MNSNIVVEPLDSVVFNEISYSSLIESPWRLKLIQRLFYISKGSEKICRSRCVAAVSKNRKIIAIGKNSLNSTRLSRRFKKNEDAVFEHAEIAAIKKGIKTGKHFDTLFVLRTIYLNGIWYMANAKPCAGCEEAIKHFNIKNVFYSNNIIQEFCNIDHK